MFPRALALASFALLAVAVGCTSGSVGSGAHDASNGDAPPPIAKIHRSRCGACHVPVEPGTRSRSVLQAALARHVDRVHLDKADWSAMLDYLAPSGVSAVHARGEASRAHN